MHKGQLTEGQIEQEIVNKGKTAKRVTPQDVDEAIVEEHYWVAPGTTTTVCCLVLYNGFTVIGKSACASSENFDAAIGRKIARDDARNQIWAFLGFLLRELALAEAENALDDLEESDMGHA